MDMKFQPGLAASLFCALLLAGCNETVATLNVAGPAEQAGAVARLAPKPGVSPAGASVAFVSISGAPEGASAAFAAELAKALAARGVSVTDAAQARFLIRAHLTAEPAEGGGSAYAFVWDIYGADRSRRHRVEEEGADPQARGEPWQAATGKLMPALVQRGAGELAAWLTWTPEAAAGATVPSVSAASAPLAYAPAL